MIYTDNENITCNSLNTNIVLIWRLILEEYGPDIEYVKGAKNVVIYSLSRIPLNGNQETTQNFTYKKEIVS